MRLQGYLFSLLATATTNIVLAQIFQNATFQAGGSVSVLPRAINQRNTGHVNMPDFLSRRADQCPKNEQKCDHACCAEKEECCGSSCCKENHKCVDKSAGHCCPNSAQKCGKNGCFDQKKEECCEKEGHVCKKNEVCCGKKCCAEGSTCNKGDCVLRSHKASSAAGQCGNLWVVLTAAGLVVSTV